MSKGEWVSLADRVGLKKGHRSPLHSNMHRVAREEFPKICVLTVTERDDGRRPETVAAIKGVIASALERSVSVFLWSSTPCTGGCPHQKMHLQRQGSAYKGHLKGLWDCRKRLWGNFVSLTKFTHGWAIEWPARCAYWSWGQAQNFLRASRPTLYDCRVDACAAGMKGNDGELVSKRWRVVTTHAGVAEGLGGLTCDVSAMIQELETRTALQIAVFTAYEKPVNAVTPGNLCTVKQASVQKYHDLQVLLWFLQRFRSSKRGKPCKLQYLQPVDRPGVDPDLYRKKRGEPDLRKKTPPPTLSHLDWSHAWHEFLVPR